jgi:hypothetical protein
VLPLLESVIEEGFALSFTPHFRLNSTFYDVNLSGLSPSAGKHKDFPEELVSATTIRYSRQSVGAVLKTLPQACQIEDGKMIAETTSHVTVTFLK